MDASNDAVCGTIFTPELKSWLEMLLMARARANVWTTYRCVTRSILNPDPGIEDTLNLTNSSTFNTTLQSYRLKVINQGVSMDGYLGKSVHLPPRNTQIVIKNRHTINASQPHLHFQKLLFLP